MKRIRRYWWSLLLICIILGGVFFWTSLANSDDPYSTIRDNFVPLVNTYREVNKRYVDKVNPEKFLRAGIDGMLSTLDPYTTYIEKGDKDQLQILTQGEYEGVGLMLNYRNNEVTVAEPPFLGTPSARVGIREGDIIIKVNGVSTSEIGFEETVQRIRGPVGTEVTMIIQREGEPKPLEFTLIREQIKVIDVRYSGIIGDDIGYVLLTRFSRNAGQEVAQSIQELQKQNVKGLIIDLRSNPGGLLESAVEVSELFLNKDLVIVSTHGRTQDSNHEFKSNRVPICGEKPIVILVNGISASASEILAGAIQDHDRGVVIGDTTFGKGLVQTVVPLSQNTALKITTAKYYTPSGRCIQKLNYSQWSDSNHTSESLVYHTDIGRSVSAEGGIIPDIVVHPHEINDLVLDLLRKSFFFNFSVQYSNTHTVPDSNFCVDEKILDEFRVYLESKKYKYVHPAEKMLNALKNEALKESYENTFLKDIDQLQKSLDRIKGDIYQGSIEDIRRILSVELSSKFFGVRKEVEVGLKEDPVILKAFEVLSNKEYYNAIFQKKN